jgi:hypothetical protein
MSRAGKMRVRKTDDFAVVVIVSGAVFVGVFVVFSVDIVRLLVVSGESWTEPNGTVAPGKVCPISACRSAD